MAALQIGDEVDVVVDGIGVRRGVVHSTLIVNGANVVNVELPCSGSPCEYGYRRHPDGERGHINRVRAQKVNPVRLPNPIRTYEQLFGEDD